MDFTDPRVPEELGGWATEEGLQFLGLFDMQADDFKRSRPLEASAHFAFSFVKTTPTKVVCINCNAAVQEVRFGLCFACNPWDLACAPGRVLRPL